MSRRNGLVYTLRSKGSPEHGIGESVTRCFAFGRFHVNVERAVGHYGFPGTVSRSVRWWFA